MNATRKLRTPAKKVTKVRRKVVNKPKGPKIYKPCAAPEGLSPYLEY